MMTGFWNKETKQYECFDTQAGDLVPVGKEKDLLKPEEMDPNWCGFCKMSPCLVATGEACCHNLVRDGICIHEQHA